VTEALLQARNLHKRFGGLEALTDVSLTIPAGAIVGVIGPNGAGKSTLIDVLSGATRPNSGEVSLEGRNVLGTDISARARLGLFRTFQHTRPSEDLTVSDILRLAEAAPASSGRGASRYTARSALAAFDLTMHADRPTAILPYGLQKVVNIAAIAICGPRVLLLDEPFAGVEQAEIERLTAIIRILQSAGVGIGLVEHNIPSVMALCGSVVVLDSGRIIFEGRPEAARDDQRVQVAYLGRGAQAGVHG
jgi:ABC-type branched-subunit amino acid transport system ATPase component